jgi:uncharacterized protein (DUF1810 family)
MREHDLSRFLEAQAGSYDAALGEIIAGAKRSHWMWFIFPQLKGLGRSAMAEYYGIASLAEARAYLDHPVLGRRYIQCVETLQTLPSADPAHTFGPVDTMKLRSSLTLFEAASLLPLLSDAIDRWFDGARDEATLRRLA